MKKLLQIGDRVRVYGDFAPACGGSFKFLDGAKGVVKQVENGQLTIKLDKPIATAAYSEDTRTIDRVHPKQCRRLKQIKKKLIMARRTLWTTTQDLQRPDGVGAFTDSAPANQSVYKWVQFTELKKGEVVVSREDLAKAFKEALPPMSLEGPTFTALSKALGLGDDE